MTLNIKYTCIAKISTLLFFNTGKHWLLSLFIADTNIFVSMLNHLVKIKVVVDFQHCT